MAGELNFRVTSDRVEPCCRIDRVFVLASLGQTAAWRGRRAPPPPPAGPTPSVPPPPAPPGAAIDHKQSIFPLNGPPLVTKTAVDTVNTVNTRKSTETIDNLQSKALRFSTFDSRQVEPIFQSIPVKHISLLHTTVTPKAGLPARGRRRPARRPARRRPGRPAQRTIGRGEEYSVDTPV
eukprot:1177475-Prorocentrum_minimum.AAC.1